MNRCAWCLMNELEIKYHDEEWGVPVHDDRKQFEYLMLEVMQCGLSWDTVLKKREIFRSCFDGFDFDKIAEYTEQDVDRIMNTPGVIRSRKKVEAVIGNARCVQRIREEFGSFSEYLWGWTNGKMLLYKGHELGEVPASNALSEKISKDLKKRGMKYLGAVTVYAHLQACGIVNDHGKDCHCYKKLIDRYPVEYVEVVAFDGYAEISKKEIEEALDFCNRQILRNLPEFTDKFQKAYSENGFYKPIENDYWTCGFWTGEIWLAYEYSHDERLRAAGEAQIQSFLSRIEKKIEVEHHDMGFLYSPSCVAGYKLIGSREGRKAAIMAADQLITRYHPVGEFIQAWGPMDAPENYRLIIDCLLNLPLLYWASEETGDAKYREIAEKHIHTAVANVIREDYSTWHTFFFDMETGAPHHGATCQGYRDGSAWARGQAWGVYGLALAYKYTGRKEYVELFRHVTEYFLTHLPKDLVPFWDLEFTDGDAQPRDSSSASIAACGMLEMMKYLEPKEAEHYRRIAYQIMKSLYDNYAVKDMKISNGLVLHSTYSNHSPYNTCNHCGVDECNSWGDYFYMEALTRMGKEWKLYW